MKVFHIFAVLVVGLLIPSGLLGQSLTGIVFAESESTPLAGASVVLLNPDFEPVARATSDVLGRFHFDVSASSYYVTAELAGFQSTLSDLLVVDAESGEEQVLMSLRRLGASQQIVGPVESPDGTSISFFGRVYDQSSRRPVELAAVEFDDASSVLTDSNGNFFVRNVQTGIRTITVTALGYAPNEISLLVEPDRAVQIDVPLALDPIELEEIEVRVRSTTIGRAFAAVWFRMGHNKHLGGVFLTRADIELRGNQPLSAMLRGVPGVHVRRLGAGEFFVTLRGPPPGRVSGSPCGQRNPALYIDGVKIGNSQQPLDLNLIPTINIEVIEIYKGAASLPGEFGGSDSRCGAIAVWTRRGG